MAAKAEDQDKGGGDIDAKAEEKEDFKRAEDKGSGSKAGGPVPVVNVTRIDISPNECPISDPLDLEIEFDVQGQLTNARWEIKVMLVALSYLSYLSR